MFIMAEREREVEGERESERERERETEYKNQAEKKFPRQFSRLLTPVPSLSAFHGNLPQQIRYTASPMFIMGTCSPHGESTSWNFPAKIKISLRPIPSFDMMSKFPGSDHSCRRRYVNKLLAERKNMNKENIASNCCLRVEYLWNGKRYSSSVCTVSKGRSRATKRCKPRISSYCRSRDIKSSTSLLSNADLYDVGKPTPVRMYSYG